MDNFYLSAIVEEIRPLIINRKVARIALTNADLLFDFRLPDDRILRASFDPSAPALFLENPSKIIFNDAHPFITTLKKDLRGARLMDIQKPALERLVRLVFEKPEATGKTTHQSLACYFTGRTANAFLLDENLFVEASLNTRGNKSLRFGEQFQMPDSGLDLEDLMRETPETISQEEVLEQFFQNCAIFSPQLKMEFLSRCQSTTPYDALHSLVKDLLSKHPRPLLYSRLPLTETAALAHPLEAVGVTSRDPDGAAMQPKSVQGKPDSAQTMDSRLKRNVQHRKDANLKSDEQHRKDVNVKSDEQHRKDSHSKGDVQQRKDVNVPFRNATPAAASGNVQPRRDFNPLPVGQIPRDFNLKTNLLLSHFPLHSLRNKIAEPAIAENIIHEYQLNSLSDAAFLYSRIRQQVLEAQKHVLEVNRFLNEEIRKLTRLLEALDADHNKYADPEHFKKLGDLLLANFHNARLTGTKAVVIDYYDPDQKLIEIEIGENQSLQQAAEQYFSRSQKARRALTSIAELEALTQPKLDQLGALLNRLEVALSIAQMDKIKAEVEKIVNRKTKSEAAATPPRLATHKRVGRRYHASSDFEIVVGKNDKENDAITFRIAGSQDIWMHAADYPGSHVVIRNPNRREVPQKVIQEAAELAAYFSQAKEQNKVAVHYTQKKFITKPPRAKPGLVRLSSFKTILVEPRCVLQKIEH